MEKGEIVLRRVELENFKGFQKAEIDFGIITVLIGPNGTGKSSIWQSLILLRQSIGQTELRVDGPLLNLGTFSNILNKNASQKEVGMLLSCDVATDYAVIGVPEGALFSYHAYFVPLVSGCEGRISVSQEQTLLVKSLSGQADVAEPVSLAVPVAGTHEAELKFKTTRTIPKPFQVSSIGGSKSLQQAVTDEVNKFSSTLETILHKTYYVPAIRGLELPDYPLLDTYEMDILPGKNAQLVSTFAYAGRDLEELVSIWCEEITGSGIGAEVIPGKRVKIDSEAARGGVPVVCDGFGTNQLVQLLLTLAITPGQSVIAIEEPEIHLHPDAQERLCNILVQVANTHEKQLIVTTHSERILWSFVRSVKDGALPQDDLAIYYFAEKGQQPQHIEQDECGDIYGWGKNFFAYP